MSMSFKQLLACVQVRVMPGLKSPMLMRSQTARSSKLSQGQIWDTRCQPLQPLDPVLGPAALSQTASQTFRSDQTLKVRIWARLCLDKIAALIGMPVSPELWTSTRTGLLSGWIHVRALSRQLYDGQHRRCSLAPQHVFCSAPVCGIPGRKLLLHLRT